MPLHAPRLGDVEREHLLRCLDLGQVSTGGAFVPRLEARLAELTGLHAVALSSGTAALQLALVAAGVRRGDEVLMPAYTFVAVPNAASALGAVPRFLDAERATLGLDPELLAGHLAERTVRRGREAVSRETGRVVRAAVAVHVYGMPAAAAELRDAAARHGVALVEDAAEALGSRAGGRHVGGAGVAAALSFNGNKTITTGGGGALLAADGEVAREARHLATTARRPHRWAAEHDRVGYNFAMPELNAALGCAQLTRLDAILADKRRLWKRYADALSGLEGVTVLDEPEGSRSNRWLVAAVLAPELATHRPALLDALHARGILARPAWTPMHRLPMYAGAPRDELPVTEDLAARVVTLPSGPGLVAADG